MLQKHFRESNDILPAESPKKAVVTEIMCREYRCEEQHARILRLKSSLRGYIRYLARLYHLLFLIKDSMSVESFHKIMWIIP